MIILYLILFYDRLKNHALLKIEEILQSSVKNLKNFSSMPISIGISNTDERNRLIFDELNYDRFQIVEELNQYLASIIHEQKNIYDTIIDSVINNKGRLFFLYGHGGTEKIFI